MGARTTQNEVHHLERPITEKKERKKNTADHLFLHFSWKVHFYFVFLQTNEQEAPVTLTKLSSTQIMKKALLLLATLTLTAVQVKADIASTVMLHHNGSTTLFAWDKVQDAVNAAVDGDTIYLSNGQFAPFNINKRIMVRGTGFDTTINGDCVINISGTTPLTMPVLDAMSFNGMVTVQGGYDQFTMRKCQMRDLKFMEGDFYDVKLDRCYVVEQFYMTKNIKEFNAFNCKFYELIPHDYTTGNAKFVHCNLFQVSDTITASFYDCALGECSKFSSAKTYTNFVGCYFENCTVVKLSHGNLTSNMSYNNTSKLVNCTVLSYESSYDGTFGVHYSNTKYKCPDGTVVGAYGGTQPFTLWPELPAVTKHVVKVDAENKKLNVTLTVDKKVKY